MSALDKNLLRGLMRKKIEDEEDLLSESQDEEEEDEDPFEALSPLRRSVIERRRRVVSFHENRKESTITEKN